MPSKIKVRSIKRKKRKFDGNRLTKRKEKDEEDMLLSNSSSDDVDTSICVVRPNSPSSDEEMADELPTELWEHQRHDCLPQFWAPKITHSGLPTVELATYLAVGIFNNSAGSLLNVLEELGIQPGVHCVTACKTLDRKRLCHSVYKSSEMANKRRRAIRNKKKGFAEALEAAEGLQCQDGAF
eukprot:Seg1064.4 transcript_id=Seg1064.4/GoldUCD/mRNA.D3Y31 product="hypothetical protein" protein_id=Seg1064.4/GoldUCD/D3Y31